MIPENTIARLNQLTVTPELRWMKGGGFLITVLSSSGLLVDAAYEKLVPRLDSFFSNVDSSLRDPLNWLILGLMTYSVHTSNSEILVLNLFVIMYLTAYRVMGIDWRCSRCTQALLQPGWWRRPERSRRTVRITAIPDRRFRQVLARKRVHTYTDE